MTEATGANREISRVTRPKEAAAATYDQLGAMYDLISGSFEHKQAMKGLRLLAAKRGETVLEIGFGSGRGLVELAGGVGPEGRVCGLDISLGMIGNASERVRDAHVDDTVSLVRGDGSSLPFAADSFDAVFMSFVLELFDTPDIPKVLSEARGALKNCGRICVVALSVRGSRGPISRLYDWAHVHFPNYADCREIGVEDFLKEAGFSVVSSEVSSMWGLPVEVVLARKA